MMTEVLNSHRSTAGVLRDFCDGDYARSHPILSQKQSLLLSLYYDELEVANPLGSKRGKHKLGELL